jgi:cysteine synthase A
VGTHCSSWVGNQWTNAQGLYCRHSYDTIAEGVGIDRLTENFLLASIDDAFHVTDQETVEMSRYLLRNEGLFVGSSSALNCVAAVRAARKLGPGHTIVTVLCDSGQRHLTKFWDDKHIQEHWQLQAHASGLEFLDASTGQP